METQAITFRIPKAMYEDLRQEAFDTRRPMNEIVAESIGTRFSLLEHGGAVVHLDGDPRNNDSENLEVREELPLPTPKNATETAVWAAWNALPDEDDESPVKRIARFLRMEPADVAFIVYPAERFGRWKDDQEPDPED